MVLFKIFLLNQCLLIISLVGLKFEFYCMLQKNFHFFQKLTSTQKSTSFFSGRNTKLRWLLCESIPLAVTNSSWFHLWDPDLRQGVKQMEEKTICHCNHINIQMSGHNYREKLNASKHDFHKASPFPTFDRAKCYL